MCGQVLDHVGLPKSLCTVQLFNALTNKCYTAKQRYYNTGGSDHWLSPSIFLLDTVTNLSTLPPPCVSPPSVCGLYFQLAASWILWSQAGLRFLFWNVTNRNNMSSKLLVLTVSVSGVTALPIHDKAYKNKYSFWTVCHTMSCWINVKIKFNITFLVLVFIFFILFKSLWTLNYPSF